MQNTLTLNRTFSINSPFILKWKINLKIFWILSLILILSSLAYYLFQVNALAKETYQIKNYQKKVDELSRDGEILKITSAKINSLPNVETLIKELGFEKIDNVNYIQVLGGTVVKQ